MTDIKTFKIKLIREPLTKNSKGDWQESAHQWLVNINGYSFDYYTGLAHRESNLTRLRTEPGERSIQMLISKYDLKYVLKHSKAVPPKVDEVLYSLVSEASACETSFPEWCADYGYDTDSRKALETYHACQENAIKLQKAGVDINAHRERLADY